MVWVMNDQTPYEHLTPETVLTAVEKLCGRATGAIFALNSYENRVYEVELEEGEPVIVKFYRPNRWDKSTIAEEHTFALELAAYEIPVVPPLVFDNQTLFEHNEYLYTIYPKRGGRPFEVRTKEDLRQLGRLLARLHNVGATSTFKHRPALTVDSFGWQNVTFLEQSGIIPLDMRESFSAVAHQVLEMADNVWGGSKYSLRLHGDCHPGNILVAQEPFLVDLDDCVSGPAVQDIWMLLSGEEGELAEQMTTLLEGYQQLRDFDMAELRLVEVLRALRMIHYSAWLARRWNDPTFPKNFPFFAKQDYWQKVVLNLKEQMAAISHPTSF